MPIRTSGYRCKHCSKLYTKFIWCYLHESACSKNPDRKSCLDCIYSERRNHRWLDTHEYWCVKQNKPCHSRRSYRCKFYEKKVDLPDGETGTL